MSHKGLFPLHVWDIIANRCHVLDIVALSRTCKLFHRRYGNCGNVTKWKRRSLFARMYHAAKEDNDRLVHLFSIRASQFVYEDGLQGASMGGHLHFVELFICKGACNLNWAMAKASKGGHFHLVEFFISKGANDWDRAMAFAAYAGHLNLVEFFISKGANNWDWAMESAAEGGHLHLVEFFIAKGANEFYRALFCAKYLGHSSIVEFLEKQINA